MTIRESLQREIKETRERFHRLLDSIPDSDFAKPSGNAAWNIGEVLYHMSIAPRFLIEDVKMIGGQRLVYRLIPILFPKRLFDWLNAKLTRFGARRLTRQFLADEYDRAHRRTLEALSQIPDEDLQKSLEYPDWDPLLSGTVTLERLFHYVKAHFDSHEEQIRSALEGT
ncbi:MAG: DinB family protein [Chloroflexota bacterium]